MTALASIRISTKKDQPFGWSFYGAGDEARTRYLHLGKVALYRMSYTRITLEVLFLPLRNIAYYSEFSENVKPYFSFFHFYSVGSGILLSGTVVSPGIVASGTAVSGRSAGSPVQTGYAE